MKLIKLLNEEFPLFNQFGDEDSDEGLHGEQPTGGDPENPDSLDDNKTDDDCQCQCDCPCCQAAREKMGMGDDEKGGLGLDDDQGTLDFSAAKTGANLGDPDSKDEFDFKV